MSNNPAEIVAIALACLLLNGCKPYVEPDWQIAPREHVCTVEQMKRVETETEYCDKATSYLDTYCYGTAIMRNCEKIHERK